MIDPTYKKMIEGKTFFITGATGLIGKCLIKMLLEDIDLHINIISLVRNLKKAQEIFNAYLHDDRLEFVVGDVCNLPIIDNDIDYIIHAASQTSSYAFVSQPVETSLTALTGTINILNFAKGKNINGLVYLSSMEIYGNPLSDDKIFENHEANLDTMNVRSSYPESKRMCETLCKGYATEYGIPAMVIRLTQTFGPGVKYDDGRVFAEFARCIIENRDIVLHTKGETRRSYLFTEDAINAILTVLLKGKPGEAYNAANEETYCSIYEMACRLVETQSNNEISVIIDDEGNAEQLGYAPVMYMNLDTSKLKALGWIPKVGIEEMYNRMIADMTINKK